MPTISAEPRRATAGPQPNYFDSPEIAARYARVRPYFHAEVAERVHSFAGVERFGSVLDVGCGSGHSSLAWAGISDRVMGIDASPSMLAAAQHTTQLRANLRYRLGVAEHLEFAIGEFDLVSAGSALHWFDQQRFYGECLRVLSPGGLLAIYNDHFTAHMQGSVPPQRANRGPAGDPVACKRWMRTRFAKRYPQPRRGMRDIDEPRAAECGFRVAHRGSFNHMVSFSRPEFIAYLLTRSNTLAALARGSETMPESVAWLDGELAAIVPDHAIGNFIFKCNYWMMRRG